MRLETRAPAKINVCLFLGPHARRRPPRARVGHAVGVARPTGCASSSPTAPRDEVHCPGVDGDNLVATAIAAFRAADRVGRRPGAHQRSTSASRSPPGWPAARPTPAPRCGCWPGTPGAATASSCSSSRARLGADVPAQVRPGRVLATGAGERLERVPGVARYGVLVVPSPEPLSTADVFREADRLGLPRDAAGLADALTDGAGRRCPTCPTRCASTSCSPPRCRCARSSRTTLRGACATPAPTHAMVSGSGPTVLGLFHDRRRAPRRPRALRRRARSPSRSARTPARCSPREDRPARVRRRAGGVPRRCAGASSSRRCRSAASLAVVGLLVYGSGARAPAERQADRRGRGQHARAVDLPASSASWRSSRPARSSG